ncbi:3-oxoacyl-[acyl-carrier protein] reductase [Thalassiosira pseudonana CCMP1335]|uniref:3-oxoacyl-[acyl-carrier protein] reductase n=1 Tax=Thalassiosira pseudonana TaxID=35128 RepID=B5YNT5_THAPS|nr:3-oxoacyl-[acyl-carrier protein] reductase [Thalassiosira pseudonana CCMP1335]ACI65043.1 3-oxoacyl-[acyl-carrier protein] reductase [Thalassiosira pseudonana CCMP1335]
MTSPQQLFNVANKNVLVSGGSRGIGYMIASTYYRHGANVLLTSRDAKACEEAAASIVSTNTAFADGINAPRVYHVPSNVSTREGCKALAEHTNDVFQGRLDVLVNNAGTSWGEDPGYDVGSRQSGRMNWGWDKVLDLNVKGVFYLIRESTQSIFSTEPPIDPGRIINIGSVTGFIPQNAPTHAYDVSKAAVHHLTKKLAADLAPRGITVNALAPGYVPSRMSSGLSTDIYEEATKTVPLGRMGNEDDMGGTCIYLSSKAGSWCTGVILNVDGGSVGAMQIPLSSL